MTEEEIAGRVKTEEVNNAGLQDDDVLVDLPKAIERGGTFMKKTFEMVEDPNTDPIVSWGETRHSLVVWDSHQFTKTLLPKYFKHSNFSSFIRQLNTYGFRKVDSDRLEFANEWFQRGKKHLLKCIRRRRRSMCNKPFSSSTKPNLEDEVEQLKNDHSMLTLEILKLTQQQEESQLQLTNVEEQVRCAELKQFHMLIFLTKMAILSSFMEQLMHKVKEKEELDGVGSMVKRCKLDTTPDVDYRHQGYNEQLGTLQSEQTGILAETVTLQEDDLFSSMHGLMTIGYDVYDVMSENLMGKSSIVGEEVDVNGSNIYLELEDLIKKSS